MRGSDYARALLPGRLINSDKEARAVAAALRVMGLDTEAREVLVTRGTFWLQRNRILQVDPASSSADNELGAAATARVTASATAAEVVKAMTFFQEAGDTMRSEALLDRALWRCCTATVNLSQALTYSDARDGADASVGKLELLPSFPRNLRLRPMKPRGAAVRGDVTSGNFMDLRHYEEFQSLPALLEQGAVLPLDVALNRLISAISNGEQLLGALVTEQTIESCFAISLRDYLGLIRALLVPRLAASESQHLGFQHALHLALSSGGIAGMSAGASTLQSEVSTRLTQESAMLRDDERLKVLAVSASALQRLLVQELVPIRYWIHLIDLSVSLDKSHSAILSSETGGLFDKAQSYHLIACAERAMILHSQYSFAQGRIHLPDPLDELNEEDAKALRLGLLEILTRAVVHANSESGSRKRKKDNAIMYSSSSESRDHGIDVASDLIAFEALSASGFL
jgi:hypothetical protein